MYDDPMERLARLRDEADVLAQQLGAAQPAQAASGSDSSGAVTVTVAGTGRVVDISVGRDWQQRVGDRELGDAVRAAAEAAVQVRLLTWGASLAEQETGPPPRARETPLPHESLAAQLNEASTARMNSDDGRVALRELLRLLESVERDIDRVSEQVRAHTNTMYTGYNMSRDVAVTISGAGAIAEVSYNRHWVLGTTASSVGRETMSALRAAYQQADQDSPDKIIANSAIGEMQTLGQDPFGLARRLHLRDH